MTELFDVVICDLETDRVNSVAGFSVPLLPTTGLRASVVELMDQIKPRLNPKFIVEIVEAGIYRKGDELPPSERRKDLWQHRIAETPSRPPRGQRDSYTALQKQRMADCQCIRCGSVNLVSSTLCDACTIINRARVSKTNASTL